MLVFLRSLIFDVPANIGRNLARFVMRSCWLRSHALAAANLAQLAAYSSKPSQSQTKVRHDIVTAQSRAFAQEFVPVYRKHRLGLTICRDFGPDTLIMMMLRSVTPRSRLLLCLKQVPLDMRSLHRFILAGVDAVLVETDTMACALVKLGVPASRIVSLWDPGDLTLFSRPRRARSDSAYRIIHVGDLEPDAGAAELLPCVAAWASRNPERDVELLWFGEGCFRGVLEAQPLPPNVTQQFPGRISREELAPIFLESDLLAIPVLFDPWMDFVLEAMTAQLPVLGSCKSRNVAQLITHGVTGWVFDPFKVGAMAHAFDLAMSMRPQELEHMRGRAAARFQQPSPELNERLRRAMQIEVTELLFNLSSLGLRLESRSQQVESS